MDGTNLLSMKRILELTSSDNQQQQQEVADCPNTAALAAYEIRQLLDASPKAAAAGVAVVLDTVNVPQKLPDYRPILPDSEDEVSAAAEDRRMDESEDEENSVEERGDPHLLRAVRYQNQQRLQNDVESAESDTSSVSSRGGEYHYTFSTAPLKTAESGYLCDSVELGAIVSRLHAMDEAEQQLLQKQIEQEGCVMIDEGDEGANRSANIEAVAEEARAEADDVSVMSCENASVEVPDEPHLDGISETPQIAIKSEVEPSNLVATTLSELPLLLETSRSSSRCASPLQQQSIIVASKPIIKDETAETSSAEAITESDSTDVQMITEVAVDAADDGTAIVQTEDASPALTDVVAVKEEPAADTTPDLYPPEQIDAAQPPSLPSSETLPGLSFPVEQLLEGYIVLDLPHLILESGLRVPIPPNSNNTHATTASVAADYKNLRYNKKLLLCEKDSNHKPLSPAPAGSPVKGKVTAKKLKKPTAAKHVVSESESGSLDLQVFDAVNGNKIGGSSVDGGREGETSSSEINLNREGVNHEESNRNKDSSAAVSSRATFIASITPFVARIQEYSFFDAITAVYEVEQERLRKGELYRFVVLQFINVYV